MISVQSISMEPLDDAGVMWRYVVALDSEIIPGKRHTRVWHSYIPVRPGTDVEYAKSRFAEAWKELAEGMEDPVSIPSIPDDMWDNAVSKATA